ncbi:hypothetical protein Adeh_3264 [Anaeromyxobacter dehalogenans 2CP-C]|uniref:Uncharacterized protein n=1 Tax=Anaeromyxobacter dehalogenans (strain 2CP-C) TaxID=290397 RepID=Q2IEM6_ANADE|nr:hypothetical protein Adeh_3264 [Anaeromyxobacter dehalogenans 2CP-C]
MGAAPRRLARHGRGGAGPAATGGGVAEAAGVSPGVTASAPLARAGATGAPDARGVVSRRPASLLGAAAVEPGGGRCDPGRLGASSGSARDLARCPERPAQPHRGKRRPAGDLPVQLDRHGGEAQDVLDPDLLTVRLRLQNASRE